MKIPSLCPLCHQSSITHYHRDKRRDYFQCTNCLLVFVPPEQLPQTASEKQEYDLHINEIDDPGYRRFLDKVFTPLVTRLTSDAQGIDFGCGPGPALQAMLIEAGFPTNVYDPFYFPDSRVLEQQYDFISCTEAIEHFHTPAKEWEMFMKMLKVGGILIIMTKRVIDQTRFANWHYKNDQTHVSFFSKDTFEYLAHQGQLSIEFISDDVVLMQKHNKK